MPKIHVDSKGTELFFTDSGAPASDDYTTLVIFHGSGFNGRKNSRLSYGIEVEIDNTLQDVSIS